MQRKSAELMLGLPMFIQTRNVGYDGSSCIQSERLGKGLSMSVVILSMKRFRLIIT